VQLNSTAKCATVFRKRSTKPEKKTAATPPPSFMSPTLRDPAKDKELLKAAQEGDVFKVKKLLAEGADVACTDPEYGATPLHWASYGGHRQVAALLLEKGANLNSTNKDGRTPLMLAAGQGHRTVVEVLLKHKADNALKDKDNRTAYDWAKGKKHKSLERLLTR
jgi:ankyrin repeat protein